MSFRRPGWIISSPTRTMSFAGSKSIIERGFGDLSPVDLDRFRISDKLDDYYLIVSPLFPIKGQPGHRGVQSAGPASQDSGHRPDEAMLRKMAGPTIEFLGWAQDDTLSDLYSHCKAFVFPGEEDFGITPLEAMASGRPVIAYAKGGALETVRGLGQGNPTGIFFREQTRDALVAAIEQFEKNPDFFKPDAIRRHASAWNRDRFKEEIAGTIEDLLKGRKSGIQVKDLHMDRSDTIRA